MSEAQTPPVELQGDQEGQQETTLEAAPSASEETEVQETESQDTAQDENEEGSGKKTSGIHRRFKKFEAALQQQAQELEYWKNVAIKGVQSTPTPVQAEKSLADFDTVEDYIAYREGHLRDQLLAEMEQAALRKTAEVQRQTTYQQKVSAAREQYSDWADVMQDAADVPVPPEVAQFCYESDVGPQIAYHLAKNPDLLERLETLSPARRLAELGKLEDKVVAPTKATKPVTKAPAKLPAVKGNNEPALPLNSGEARSYTEWKAIRDKQKAVKR